ncbi:MAG: AmmeMemoRadiSam system protein B [Desulfobacterota bacterium]|nr:AmmeMemoRadiSam system protein B [Thermodesulfobacteriota bacterium]MDW8001379.1 AmmeMemoRadiSam system protein B [Deltaproteobacteria bacterium]
MECPKLRPVEMVPVKDGQKELILIRDPEGILEENLVVSKDVAYLFCLMNGKRTLRDLQAEYMKAFGELIYIEKLNDLIASLDKHFLLENENYYGRLNTLKREYEASQSRPAYLAGKSYPANRMELLLFLDSFFSEKEKRAKLEGRITGVLSPHIDYLRGRDVYVSTYEYLRNLTIPLIVIFGTSHKVSEKLWNISIKDFLTPIDRVPVSNDLKKLISGNKVLKDYICEWPHRTEHSIELQLPLLQFTIQNEFEILPILTGSMHEYVLDEKNPDDGEIEDLVSSLKSCLDTYGKPHIVLSAADLAHIGAQFGDEYPLDIWTLKSSQAKDERLLEAVKECDAQRFLNLIKEEKDRRRICGLAPIYFQLKMVSGSRCQITKYKQWTDGASSVSFAGAIFYTDE